MERKMKIQKTITIGIISGLIMGITLFIAGAIFSRIIYGPQFAPSGKFEPEQLNALYFIWTKLLIGIFFGILFTLLYEKLPLSRRLSSALAGLKYGFFLWFAISIWNLSHPLIYGSINNKDQLFWLIYSLCGFLAYGYSLGYLYKRISKDKLSG
ncbi:MAG: hypothetical protein IMY71_00890 [Bacteroidetes bacterium]|nr:hypothetical protein [Bacteroidota bacterium]